MVHPNVHRWINLKLKKKQSQFSVKFWVIHQNTGAKEIRTTINKQLIRKKLKNNTCWCWRSPIKQAQFFAFHIHHTSKLIWSREPLTDRHSVKKSKHHIEIFSVLFLFFNSKESKEWLSILKIVNSTQIFIQQQRHISNTVQYKTINEWVTTTLRHSETVVGKSKMYAKYQGLNQQLSVDSSPH